MKEIRSTRGIVHQGLADDFPLAGQVLEHAGRQAGLLEDADEVPAHRRGLLGGLEDHRVFPATKAAAAMPIGIARGKFQGGMTTTKPSGDALDGVGLAGDVAVLGLGQADHLAGVELAEVDRFGHVAVGLAPGLAALEDLPGGQLEPAGPEDRGGADQDLGPLPGGCLRPGEEGPAGRGDGLVGMVFAVALADSETMIEVSPGAVPTRTFGGLDGLAVDQEGERAAELACGSRSSCSHASFSRASGRVKSVSGSFSNRGRGDGAGGGPTLQGNSMAPTSSGSRKRAFDLGPLPAKLALRNDSFDVFSRRRRTR